MSVKSDPTGGSVSEIEREAKRINDRSFHECWDATKALKVRIDKGRFKTRPNPALEVSWNEQDDSLAVLEEVDLARSSALEGSIDNVADHCLRAGRVYERLLSRPSEPATQDGLNRQAGRRNAGQAKREGHDKARILKMREFFSEVWNGRGNLNYTACLQCAARKFNSWVSEPADTMPDGEINIARGKAITWQALRNHCPNPDKPSKKKM
jgi:hypothetical protein